MENEPIIVSTQEQMFTEKQYIDKETITRGEIVPINILPTRETNETWSWQDDGINEVKVEFYDKDSITGNYKLSLVKEFECKISEKSDENILEGYLLVPVELDGKSKMYLRDISIPINLDLNLFGNNTLELSSWGFTASKYFEEGQDLKTTVTIRYNLNSYFSDEVLWEDLKLEYKDLTDGDTEYSELNLNSLGGQVTIKLTARHIYQVKISYGVSYPDSTTTEQKSIDNLWILSTQLFNDCFNIGENYINNYCSPKKGKEQEIFDELTTIELEITGDINIQLEKENSIESGFKKYYTTSQINFEITNNKTFNIDTSSLNIQIKNEQLYPEIDISGYTKQCEVENIIYSDPIDDYIQGNRYNYNGNYTIDTNITNTDGNKIEVTYKDFLKGIAATTDTIPNVPYVFHNLTSNIVREIPYTNRGGLEIRCPAKGVFDPIEYVQVSLNVGNSDWDNYSYIDGFSVVDGQGEQYFFNQTGVEHPNFQRWHDYTILNDKNYVFMYRDNKDDIYDYGSPKYFYTFAPTSYRSTTSGQDTDTRNYGECKFFLYAKTYDNSNEEDILLNDSIKNDNLTWGIASFVDCSDIEGSEMKRTKVVDEIISLFPSNSIICTKQKEDLQVYTIMTASSNPSTYYSHIENLKLEKDLKIIGKINGGVDIDLNFNDKITFKINSQGNKTFNKQIAILNSYKNYLYLLANLPTLDKYLDFDKGEYVSDQNLGNRGSIYNHVYTYTAEGGYKQVLNVLVIKYNNDQLIPIFCKNKNDDKYKYMISELPINSEQPSKYILNFDLFNENPPYKNLRPYPIYSLTVNNS